MNLSVVAYIRTGNDQADEITEFGREGHCFETFERRSPCLLDTGLLTVESFKKKVRLLFR